MAGDSGFIASSPMASRSMADGTLRVTRRVGLSPDLRRPSGVLVGGAMGEKLGKSRVVGRIKYAARALGGEGCWERLASREREKKDNSCERAMGLRNSD